MTPKNTRTKDVAKSFYANFLQRSKECLHAAQHAFESQEWTATAINAIHATIAACDAMCVYFLGKRPAGENHNESVNLFKTISNKEEIRTNANRISRIIRTKNIAEYEERLIFKSEAEKILKDCQRLLDYVFKELPN